VSGASVSVIIPTCQRRELVTRAVASVLTQTYRDFELIVVDDGSTDGTHDALAPLCGRLQYRWQPNRGVAAARNAGLRLACGSIVAFLDSDDRWLSDHLAVVTEALEREPAAVLASTTPRHLMEGRASAADAVLLDPLPTHFFGNPVGHPSSVAVRRDAVLEVGGFDERLAAGEGAELWARLAFHGPFSLIRRRTIIKQRTAGSLLEQGRDRGGFLDAFDLTARMATRRLDRLPDRARRPLAARAQGALQFVVALRALDRGDVRAVIAALEEACRLLPQLCRDAESVDHRLSLVPHAGDPRERLRHLVTFASLWPEPRSETALFLRARAVLLALRLRRPREAARLLARWPLRTAIRPTLRALALLTPAGRRDLKGYVERIRETTTVKVLGEPALNRS
jgi:hypothetical protein